MGFHAHQSLLISAARGFRWKCCGEPLFSPSRILHAPQHSGTLEALLRTRAGRAHSSGPAPASNHPSRESSLGTPQSRRALGSRLLCSGPPVPPHCGLFVVFLSCPLFSRCRPPVFPDRFARSFSLDAGQRLHFHRSPVTESLLSMGKGWSSLPSSCLHRLFSSNGAGHREHFPEASI